MLILQMGRTKSTIAGTSKDISAGTSKGKRLRIDSSEEQPNRQLFMTKEKEKRHEIINNWTFIPE